MTRRPFIMAGILALALANVASEAAAAPRKISGCTALTNRGAYVLTRNIDGTAAPDDCITVESPDVSINLNGFGIFGPGVTGGAIGGHGIRVLAGNLNVAVRNGSVTGWDVGILFEADTDGAVVERIRVYANVNAGISVQSRGALIRANVAHNTATGIAFFAGSTVLSNVTNDNAFYGIFGLCDSTVMFNTASPPAPIDCAIWGFKADTAKWMTTTTATCLCFDTDGVCNN